MKKLLFAMMVFLFTQANLGAQTPLKVFTSPKLPAREALERMNLTLAWNVRVPVAGNRDGIVSLQLLPGSPNQIVAQTYQGAVHLFNADNGDLLWKTRVGVPYWVSQPVGFNSQSIFVSRRDMLHVLNRQTGAQRVYSYDLVLKTTVYGMPLQFTPSAPLVADEEFLYVCMDSHINAFAIPDFETFDKIKRAREAKGKGKREEEKKELAKESLRYVDELPPIDSPNSLQPLYYWGYRIPQQNIAFAPLFSGDQISILTPDGVLTSINRFDQGPRVENFEFKFNGPTLAGAGQYGRIAYVGSEDFTVYAVEMAGGKLLWRHLSGSPIPRQPYVNDRNVFVAPSGVGLRALDRRSGRENWTNRDTQYFLATNNQYVYARDKVGRFFVLDGRRGGTLAKVDFSDWTISIANEWTDRIFLAANDGQIMCLRHRDLATPMILKALDAAPKPKEEKKKDEEKKEEMEKKDEKKEIEKKDAARVGRASLEAQPLTMSPRWEAARRSEPATQDRRAWAAQ